MGETTIFIKDDEGEEHKLTFNTDNPTLNIESKFIGVEGMKKLAPHLPNSRVTSLKIGNNQLGDEGIEVLSKHLPNRLTHLDVIGNHITYKGMKVLSEYLPNSNVKSLDISLNKTGIQEMEMLCNLLSKGTIAFLCASMCEIGDEEIELLSKNLPNNNLTHLDISGNRIGNEGIKNLVTHLLKSNLTHLDIKYNYVTDYDVIEDLSNCLPQTQLITLKSKEYIEGINNDSGQTPVYKTCLDVLKKVADNTPLTKGELEIFLTKNTAMYAVAKEEKELYIWKCALINIVHDKLVKKHDITDVDKSLHNFSQRVETTPEIVFQYQEDCKSICLKYGESIYASLLESLKTADIKNSFNILLRNDGDVIANIADQCKEDNDITAIIYMLVERICNNMLEDKEHIEKTKEVWESVFKELPKEDQPFFFIRLLFQDKDLCASTDWVMEMVYDNIANWRPCLFAKLLVLCDKLCSDHKDWVEKQMNLIGSNEKEWEDVTERFTWYSSLTEEDILHLKNHSSVLEKGGFREAFSVESVDCLSFEASDCYIRCIVSSE